MHLIKSAKPQIILVAGTLALVVSMGLSPLPASANSDILDGAKKAGTSDQQTVSVNNFIPDLINFLLFAIGLVSVIMIIVGGIKLTTSNGNAEQIKSGKNTIMYSIIGLIVAILAYAIVNFVIDAVSGSSGGGGGGGVSPYDPV